MECDWDPAPGQTEDHHIRATQDAQPHCQPPTRVISIGKHLDTSEVRGNVASRVPALVSLMQHDGVSLQRGNVVGGDTEQAVGEPTERPRDGHLVADLRHIGVVRVPVGVALGVNARHLGNEDSVSAGVDIGLEQVYLNPPGLDVAVRLNVFGRLGRNLFLGWLLIDKVLDMGVWARKEEPGLPGVGPFHDVGRAAVHVPALNDLSVAKRMVKSVGRNHDPVTYGRPHGDSPPHTSARPLGRPGSNKQLGAVLR
jgi:hypothetical protein